MFKVILLKKYKKLITESYNKGYDKGIANGYDLGFMMSEVEKRNRSFIGIEFVKKKKLDYEIEDILRNKGEL